MHGLPALRAGQRGGHPPHLGAGTAEAQERAGTAVAASVRQALSGRFVPEAVNVRTGAVDGALDPWLTLTEQLGRLFTSIAGGLPRRLRVRVDGEIAGHDTAALELAAIKGALGGVVEGGVSYVNAPLITQERGMCTELVPGADSPVHRSLVTLSGVLSTVGHITVAGTLTGLNSGSGWWRCAASRWTCPSPGTPSSSVPPTVRG
ncbi:hypothetical protein ACFWSF_08420 [Streptomyces sp. NPDC058611]|uniref:hypothetical protein n=1 Tax=unclassified Streptomyces TaxID=2593676 RepID=UPI00364ACF0F